MKINRNSPTAFRSDSSEKERLNDLLPYMVHVCFKAKFCGSDSGKLDA
jgi:hypothetical protein